MWRSKNHRRTSSQSPVIVVALSVAILLEIVRIKYAHICLSIECDANGLSCVQIHFVMQKLHADLPVKLFRQLLQSCANRVHEFLAAAGNFERETIQISSFTRDPRR